MTNFTVFYRVPAKHGYYGTYLSSTRIEARSYEEAIAKVQAQHPEYTEVH